MSRLSRRVLAGLAVALLVVPALMAPVAADHSFSHRYIIMGRLVDANGDPIVGEQVELVPDDAVPIDNACDPQPNTETDAWGETNMQIETNAYGEFRYCLHVHGISRGTDAEFAVKYGDAETSFPIDPAARFSFVTLQTETDEGDPESPFHEDYLVAGRLYYDTVGGSRVENIKVQGDVVQDEPVEVTMTPSGGEPVTVETTTNGYGDFGVRVPVADVDGATITVSTMDRTYTYDVDPVSRATWNVVDVPNPDNPLMTALMVIGGIVGVVVIGGGGFFAWRRVSEQREAARARETSTRKRAKLKR